MKRIVILSALLSVILNSSFGQWYYDKYNVRDIDSLTLKQLDESLDKTKKDLATGGIITVVGGLIIGGGFLTLYTGLPEDPTFLEELLGSEVMGKAYIIGGAAVANAGFFMCVTDFGRLSQIKSVKKRNYPLEGSLKISPVSVFNGYSRSTGPGISVTVNF